MATASQPPSEPLAVSTWADDGQPDSKSERYLARRLAAASADYKGVALITFLLGAGVATLVWVACGVVLEHWLVPGGLPRWARWTWLLTGLAAIVAAGVRWILPLMRYRVNLVYAARVIEKEHPELHNDLVNTVLVKAHPEGNAATVVKSLERRAAKRLSSVPAESVIDRSLAVGLAYALAALVGLACVYSLVAPKSLLTTTARLLAPWARVAAPTRVRLEPPRLRWRMPGEDADPLGPGAGADAATADGNDPHDSRNIKVEAGGATLVRGRQLVVTTAIHGLRRDDRPIVTVTPVLDSGAVDGAAVPWRADMTRVGGETGTGQRYAAVLPDAARGLDQSVTFTIQAGDARSEPIRVAMVDSPTLMVREVRYEFPAYMRRESETVAWQGDLRGVEGTRVVIVAESNQPLESAWIDFDCDGSRDLKLKVGASDLARATGSFVLQMNPERTSAEHGSYRLLLQPRGTALADRGQVQAEKLEHRIEVQADLAPEISIEEPLESPARVPPGAPVTVRVRALDPDFGLARVGLETRVKGGAAQPEIVLPGSERSGAFNGSLQLVPERLGAGGGSTLEYRGVAVDTRPSQPNVTHTPWKLLQIDASAPPRQPEKAPPRSGEQKKQGDEKQENGEGESGKASDDSRGASGENGGQGSSDGREGGRQEKDQGKQGEEGPQQQGPQQQGPQGEQREQGGQQQKPKDGKESGGAQQRQPQQGQPQQNSGQQGEAQPGQQGGAASGSQQGGKQPQAGENKQQGSSQGQSGEAGGADGPGTGRGTEGKGGTGAQSDGKQSDGESGAGGQQGGRQNAAQDSAQRPGGAKSGSDAGGAGGADGSSQGKQTGDQRGMGNQKGGSQKGGSQQPRPAVAADGTNDGEAMERILDHRRQAGDNSSDGMKAGKTKPDGDGAGESGRGSDGKAGENSSNEGKSAGQNPANKPGEGNPRDGASADGESQPGAGGEKSGKSQGDKGQQGQGQQGQGQQGQGQQGQGQQGQGQQGQGQQGQGQQGQGQQGQGQQGQGQQGQGQQGQGQQGQGQQGQGQQGQGQQGQGQQGQGQQGQGQQGQGQQGQGQQGQGQQGQGDAAGPNAEESGSKKGGNPATGPAGQGAAQPQGDPQQEGEAGGKPSGQPAAGPPPEGASQSSPVGGGGWSEGAGTPTGGAAAQGPPPSRETEWGSQELENARNAADLALEHLRTTVDSGRTDVLDELGWTRDQARAFLDRWESMRRQSESPDLQKRGEFERVLRSLGLRPAGVQSSREVPADAKGGQAEGRRSRPPSDYRERFKAFLQGTSGEQDGGSRQDDRSKPGNGGE
jgi:hypothetical protein